MTKNRLWVAGLATPVVIAMLLLSVGSPSVRANDQPAAANVAVKIDNFVFGPQVLDTDEKYSFTFSKAGTFPYFCPIHPKMTGQVVVK